MNKKASGVVLRVLAFLLCFWGVAAGLFGLAAHSTAASGLVYVIPVEQTIESGLESFLKRGIEEAEKAGADVIVLRINTLGGAVNAAIGIGEAIRSSRVPTVAFVQGKAISAGSYIALNADQIVMAPGSSIGAAAVVDISGNRVTDSKTIAAWAGQMRSAAEINGRNPDYAEGMVDDSKVIEVPEIGKTFGKGELISFTAEEALKAGYAETVASDLTGVLEHLGMEDAAVETVEPTVSERLARFLTNPAVMTILLLLGFGGIAFELLAPGFGVPGIVGVCAFVLFFFGNIVAGFAGIEHIILFVAGIILLVLELFIPSFGILGVSGFICLVLGIVLAQANITQALSSLGISLLVVVVIMVFGFRRLKDRGIWNRFVLRDEFKSESGYVPTEPKDHLLGQTGTALTVLRPAGIARIGDERVDVVTDGEYVEAGRRVKVIHVEGTRVVVREIGEQERE